MALPVAETTVIDLLQSPTPDLDLIVEARDRVRRSRRERAALQEGLAALGRHAEKDARLAVAHWALGHNAEAAEHAAKAMNHPLGAYIAGVLADAAGRFEDALNHFRKAAGLAPTCAPIALAPIDSLRRLGRLDEALALIESRRRDFSDKALLAFHEARCLEDLGRHDEALDRYHKALEIAPGNADAAFRAAYLSDLRGNESKAVELYSRIGPDHEALYPHACLNLALLHDDAGDYEKAAACCRRVLKADPRNSRAKMFLADIDAARAMYYSPEETKQSERLEAVLRVPVTDFELSVRSRNCLANMNIQTLGDLVKRTESEMLAYKNFGETSLREVKEMLTSRGLRLGMLREDAATRAAMERQRRNQSLEVLQKPIAEMELGVRAKKCCETLGLVTIGDLVAKSETELQSARNFGRVSLNEIKKRLTEMGLSLRDANNEDEIKIMSLADEDDAELSPSIEDEDLI